MIHCKFWLTVLTGLLLYTRIYGQLAINMPEVGNYGEETHMNCTEAGFVIANGYTWYKANVIIYDTVNGDATSSGKYTSTYGTGYFTLTITNTTVDDAGVYACNYNFVPQSGTLEIQAIGTVTAELSSSSSGKLEVTFQKIYPNTFTVVITCDSIIEMGDFVSNEPDGDRFNIKWESEKNFTSVPSDCSVNVTLVTTFNVPFVVKSAPTVAPTTVQPTEIYDCPGLGNSTAVDSVAKCAGCWLGICCLIILFLIALGIVLEYCLEIWEKLTIIQKIALLVVGLGIWLCWWLSTRADQPDGNDPPDDEQDSL